MSTQAISQSLPEKINLIVLPQINLRKIWISGFILITLLLIFYIFQISEITRVGFFIFQYEEEIVRLSQQNKNLEIGISQVNSLANLEAILSNLDYEKVGEVRYLRLLDGTVLAK